MAGIFQFFAMLRKASQISFVAASSLGNLRVTAPFDDLVERSNNTLGRQRKIHVDDQAIAIEIIDHVEQANAATVAQLVVHEVQRPGLIHRRGNSQRQWPLAHGQQKNELKNQTLKIT